MTTNKQHTTDSLDRRYQAAIDKLIPDNGQFRLIPAHYLTMDIDQLESLAEQKEMEECNWL